jgi:hypothetical protein
MTKSLYEIADELRSIANMGLLYTHNDYDRERYLKVQLLSARLFGLLFALHASSRTITLY